MRNAIAITVMTVFGAFPALGSACEYEAETSASAAPAAQLVAAETPAASKAPSSTVLKAPVPKTTTARQAADKNKAPARDVKLAALSPN